jgi:hypothetical protein
MDGDGYLCWSITRRTLRNEPPLHSTQGRRPTRPLQCANPLKTDTTNQNGDVGENDTDSPMTRLTNIRLQNFQSIHEKVDLPIRPLTFLYGPNSAGKSAVYDALCVIDSLLHEPKSAYGERTFTSLMAQWGDPYVRGADSQPITLVSVRYEKSSWSCPEDIKSGVSFSVDAINQKLFEAKHIEVRIHSSNLSIPTIEILIDDTEAIRISASNAKPDENAFLESTSLIVSKAWIALAEREAKINRRVSTEDALQSTIFVDVSHGPLRVDLTTLAASHKQAATIGVARMIIECARLNFRLPDLVPGDRGLIPRNTLGGMFTVYSFVYESDYPDLPEELDCLHLGCCPGLTHWQGNSPSSYGEGFRIDSPASKVAASFFMQTVKINTEEIVETDHKAISMGINDYDWSGLERLGWPSAWTDTLLHEFINACFSDHLFQNGYQLAAEVTAFGFIGKPDDEGRDGGISAGMVRWHLVDVAGRKFTFEDVGSGVSCVLPVLVAAFEGGGFIQQPELHLHPALQSELGDIFISASQSRRSFHLIETHSEYPLLRCLRRIRETTEGKRSAQDPYALEADQVMILYFDPQGDGSTRVIPIRVSRQGEFIDRWPRGFFEERGRELFGE